MSAIQKSSGFHCSCGSACKHALHRTLVVFGVSLYLGFLSFDFTSCESGLGNVTHSGLRDRIASLLFVSFDHYPFMVFLSSVLERTCLFQR